MLRKDSEDALFSYFQIIFESLAENFDEIFHAAKD